MFSKKIIAAMATMGAAAALFFAAPASAATYTAPDGILSIELPDENWKEIADASKWIVLSDGANMISMDHFSNGEKLPEMSVADEHYVNVYDVVYSTQNEVFVITGAVVDSAKVESVRNAITSVKILQYDTKLAVKKDDAAKTSDFTIAPLDKTMYVIGDGVNVRSGWSTSDSIVGGVGYGESVKVTGSVQQGGKDYGWYQIAYGNGRGYVSAQFLTDTPKENAKKEDEKKETTERKFTGNAKTIYDADGKAVTVYESTDGQWYDGNGNGYYWVDTYTFSGPNGGTYTLNKPAYSSGLTVTGDTVSVFWLNGNGETLTPYSDGYYYSSGGVRYTYDNGVYHGADGTTLYTYMQNLGSDDADVPEEDQADYYLTSRGSGRPVNLYDDGDGTYSDDEGNDYYLNDDGTFYDDYGAIYDAY